MIPKVPREILLLAMDRFDRELRHSPEWQDWEQHENHKYAIEHNGRRFPVKGIIRLAASILAASFNGGYQANSYVMKRGFTVVRIESGEVMRY